MGITFCLLISILRSDVCIVWNLVDPGIFTFSFGYVWPCSQSPSALFVMDAQLNNKCNCSIIVETVIIVTWVVGLGGLDTLFNPFLLLVVRQCPNFSFTLWLMCGPVTGPIPGPL